MNINRILNFVKEDRVTKFIGEIKNVSKLDDIDKIISKIYELDVEEQYKIKYIVIIILGNLIKEKKYQNFKQDYFILREVFDYDVLKFKEYLISQNIINKLLHILDNTDILDILKEYKNEDSIYVDLLLGVITIEYLKNNKFRLSSVVKYLIQKKEKKAFYFLLVAFSNFDFEFIRNFLESDNYIELTSNEYYTILNKYLMDSFTQEESLILRKLLTNKIYDSQHPISRNEVLEGRNYHDEYQDKYCKNFIKNNEAFQGELKPLIVLQTEISLPYKKILKFNRDTLYELPKQSVHTLRISYKNDNFSGGNKHLYDIKEDFNFDLKWYNDSITYLENLSIKDKMTVMGYTHNGDKYANMYLMQDIDSLTSYLEEKFNDEYNSDFFPLYFQAKEKIMKEKDDILKYFTGEKKDLKKFMENFINPIASDIEEIKSYNLILKNRRLLSPIFWFDVIRIFVDDLDRIIKQSPPIKSTMVVFRGATSKYYKTDSNQYVNNTFMSTSFDYKIPLNFVDYDCCLKKIILKPGSRALFVESLTQSRGEHEILLGLNNKFNIIEDSTKHYYNLHHYNLKEEYPDNLCIESEQPIDVTVMEVES